MLADIQWDREISAIISGLIPYSCALPRALASIFSKGLNKVRLCKIYSRPITHELEGWRLVWSWNQANSACSLRLLWKEVRCVPGKLIDALPQVPPPSPFNVLFPFNLTFFIVQHIIRPTHWHFTDTAHGLRSTCCSFCQKFQSHTLVNKMDGCTTSTFTPIK